MIIPSVLFFKKKYVLVYFIFYFSVPVHKVDDITHVNFTDRDHLWFDPNWKNSNGGGVGTGHASNASGGTNNNTG